VCASAAVDEVVGDGPPLVLHAEAASTSINATAVTLYVMLPTSVWSGWLGGPTLCSRPTDRESGHSSSISLLSMATNPAPVSTHDAMLDAASGLIVEIGYTEMSHADITAAVGMGRTTFYEHFSSKEDLLVALVNRDLPPLTVELLDAVDSSLPPDERLYHLGYKMVEFVGTDHLGLILHTEVPRLSNEAQVAISDAHAGLAGEFASIYRDGVAEGMFRSIPHKLAGRMMEQIMMTGGKVVMDSPNPQGEVDEIARNTAEVLVSALRVPG
jgi:AcrR family transcriptional regulator